MSASSLIRFLLLLALLQVTVQLAGAVDAPPVPAPQVESGAAARPLPVRPQAPLDTIDYHYQDAFLSEDVTWHGTVVIDGWLTLAPQATITVDPGTVVRFRHVSGSTSGLMVRGRLNVAGSSREPVRFTSMQLEPLPGDWIGIVFAATDKKNQLAHLRIQGAIEGIRASFASLSLTDVAFDQCRTGMRLQDTQATMTGGSISGGEAGIIMDNSELDVQDAALSDSGRAMVGTRSSLLMTGCTLSHCPGQALRLEHCRLRLERSTFDNNLGGGALIESEGTIIGTRFIDNRESGLELVQSSLKISGSVFSGNDIGIKLDTAQSLLIGNAIYANKGYNIFYTGGDMLLAGGNWWGDQPSADVHSRIYDRQADANRGMVLTEPVLHVSPVGQ